MNGVAPTPASPAAGPQAAPREDAIERINHPEIFPFEVWDLLVGGTEWVESFYESGFTTALQQGIESLHDGTAQTRSCGPVLPMIAGFDAVFLTGGRAGEEQFRDKLPGLRIPIVFDESGTFSGVTGGFHWLRSSGLEGWALDLGQSQLKLASPDRRWVFPRDSTRLRATGEVSSAGIPAQRRRLREFIALKLQLAVSETRRRPQVLVAALPARIAADGTPMGGNYAGLRGYRDLIPDVLQLAGLTHVRTFVVNDAELAAFSAGADPRLARFRKILVLTLGFGIGAALVCRSPWR